MKNLTRKPNVFSLREGLTTLSAGTVDYTGGDDVRLAYKQLSAKPEAHKSIVCS